jgi:4-amino-4-deoxy-L-arabinose transferase-like glycosyltransferase
MVPSPYTSASIERPLPARRARWAVLAALLVFWGLALWNLDRYPPIHFDEATILEPGFQLFYKGVYGAPMYTGFYGQERLYLEVPPLMSLLQGASTWLLGVGVWQMRYLPVVCGLFTLALTAALALRVAGPAAGVAAAWLLLLWKWTPSDLDFLGSGLPLLDVSRIARYDILVPVFGLSAFLAWLRGRAGARPWLLFASGLLAGLSGLANVYGAFWIAALGLLTLLDNGTGRLRRLAALLAGAAPPVLGWAAVLALHPDETRGQFIKHAGRFDLLQPSFYLENVLNEAHRYFLGVRDPATYLRLGFWLAVLGLPASLAWLALRWRHAQDARAAWLLAPALVLPALLALLDSEKRFYYLIVAIPVFAVIVAWAATETYQAASRNWRGLMAGAAALLALQGALGVASQQGLARQSVAPATVYAQLRDVVPAGPGIILGSPQLWLGLPATNFRSIVLPFLLSLEVNPKPVPFETALNDIDPRIVLMDPELRHSISADYGPPFWDFMTAHHARVIGQVPGYEGHGVTVYELEP